MVAEAGITTALLAVMEEVVADLLLDTVQVAEQVAKAIPAHQAVIIGQAMEAAEPVKLGQASKAGEVLPVQSLVLLYLEQAVGVEAAIHQSIVATELMAAAEATGVLQIGATAITHTVKILVEDGE